MSQRRHLIRVSDSLPGIRLDQSGVNLSSGLAAILDVGRVTRGGLDDWHRLRGGRSSDQLVSLCGGLGSSGILGGDFPLLIGELGLMKPLLLGLDLLLVLLALHLSDLLDEELVLPLQLVGVLARGEEVREEEDGEEEGGDGVPDEGVGVDDAEGEDAPPVESVEDPEADEREDDANVVACGVLVHALVVGLVDRVVPVSVALKLRLLAHFRVDLDCRRGGGCHTLLSQIK